MSPRRGGSVAALVMAASAAFTAPAPAAAQALGARVAGAPEGRVQFSFAAREGVCGDGRTFLSFGESFFGSFVSGSASSLREGCVHGPVRVVLDRTDGAVIAVETAAGGTTSVRPAGVTDLGTVSARDAADYLLSLAARLDGRPGRDAILPAALADSVDVAPRLLAIGRDRDRPRETRRSALSWLVRVSEDPSAARRVSDALVAIARDAEDHAAVRQQALSSLTRLENGAGIMPLVALARPTADDAWLAREATEALARSGDPRAREHLRGVVQKGEGPEGLLTVAIRGLAREYATARDVALLRDAFARVQGERARQAVIQSVAELGGSENARWLLGIAQRSDERPALRRAALNAASRAGVASAELVRLYDRADRELQELLLGIYAESGDRAAVDRLLAVAKSEEDRALRRRAIQLLGRLDDPRAKALLQEIVVER